MMKITGLSHLFKWENLHNWWLTKYFFAPLYLTQLNAGPDFRFGNVSLSQVFYIKKKMTMLTRILASSVRIIPWTLGSPFLSFFITGGGCNYIYM